MTEDASKRCIHCIHYANGKCYNHSAVRDGKGPWQYVNDAPRDIPDPGNTPEWCPRDDGTVTMYDFIHPVASSCEGCVGHWPFGHDGTHMGGLRFNSCGRYVIYPTGETDRVCPFYSTVGGLNRETGALNAEGPAVTREAAETIVHAMSEKNPLYWFRKNTDYHNAASLGSPACNDLHLLYHEDDTVEVRLFRRIGKKHICTSQTHGMTSAKIDIGILVMTDGKWDGNAVGIPIVEMTVEEGPLEEEECAECPASKPKIQTLDKWGVEI